MAKKILASTLLAAIVILSGCDKVHTVNDFRKDIILRDKVIDRCANGELDGDGLECRNAHKAKYFPVE